jgi:membrane protein DedA with SNARE-associated domain
MSLGIVPDILHFIRGNDFAGILQFLQTSGYGIMFILMIIEGPIITYIASFAASLGIFNIFYIFILSSLGNIIGDLILFLIGRGGKKTAIDRYESKSLNSTRLSRLKMYLERNPGKAIVAIKLTPFLPIPGLILAGASNISLKKFITYSALVSMTSALLMTFLGFYSGVAFLAIAKYVKYLEYLIGITLILIIFIFYSVKFISKKLADRIEKI